MRACGQCARRLVLVCAVVVTALMMTVGEGGAHDAAAPGDQDMLTTMVTMEALSPALILLTVGIAMGLGAAHALSPGHGKALVAAYLVGTRSRPMDAVMLGAIVTVTHTAGVFLLGLATLAASNWMLSDRLLPWLSVVSGLIVFAVGLYMLTTRLRQSDHHHHHHDHSHPHPATGGHGHAALDRGSLWALGVSGGALPCPSALMLLLTAVALNRVAYGLVLLVAFSVGLGAVLTLTGWLFLKAGNILDRFSSAALFRRLPLFSAVLVMALGLTISINALRAVL